MSRISIIFIFAVLVGIVGGAPAMATDDLLAPVTPIDRIYPADGQVIDNSADYDTNFRWSHMEEIDYYRVVIVGDDQVFHDKWYDAAQACQEGVCTTSSDIWLGLNSGYDFWMTRWNPTIGAGYVNMWEKTSFTVDMPMPLPPAAGSGTPTGETNDSTPSLTWQNSGGSHAMWYQIWVGPSDLSGPMTNQWFNRDEVCSSEVNVCGFTIENALPHDDYIVFGRAWNMAGMSPWVILNQFSVKFGLTIE